jgi:hypothetical protein
MGGAGGSIGEGGSGASASNFGEDGPACFACLQGLIEDSCEGLFVGCFGQSSCQGWYGCTDECAHGDNSHACYTGCDEAYLPSNSANQNLKVCGCDACADVCPSFCTCGYLVE